MSVSKRNRNGSLKTSHDFLRDAVEAVEAARAALPYPIDRALAGDLHDLAGEVISSATDLRGEVGTGSLGAMLDRASERARADLGPIGLVP